MCGGVLIFNVLTDTLFPRGALFKFFNDFSVNKYHYCIENFKDFPELSPFAS